jgi:hypothetical protein
VWRGVRWDLPDYAGWFIGGEASHDGATSWTFNQDSVCAGTCVVSFDTTDFQRASLPSGWLWGLNPPAGFGDGSVAATQAAGGPDSSGHYGEFTDPADGLVDATADGDWNGNASPQPAVWSPSWLGTA